MLLKLKGTYISRGIKRPGKLKTLHSLERNIDVFQRENGVSPQFANNAFYIEIAWCCHFVGMCKNTFCDVVVAAYAGVGISHSLLPVPMVCHTYNRTYRSSSNSNYRFIALSRAHSYLRSRWCVCSATEINKKNNILDSFLCNKIPSAS